MNIPDYIESGVLADYCLGVLNTEQMAEVELLCAGHPELKHELTRLQNSLENYVAEKPVWRKAAMKERIWDMLSNIDVEEKAIPGNFPVINKYSDHKNWLKIVEPFRPADFREGMFTKVMNHNEQVTHILMMSYEDDVEEIHTDLKESFIILEGECECYIDGEVTRLSAGGYLEIPLHAKHNVKVLSPYVVAVVQRIAV